LIDEDPRPAEDVGEDAAEQQAEGAAGPAIAPRRPSAFAASSPSAKVVVMIDSAAGETRRAAEPCSAARRDQHLAGWRAR
jgi:hypothetical protein